VVASSSSRAAPLWSTAVEAQQTGRSPAGTGCPLNFPASSGRATRVRRAISRRAAR
jgi:hypothetical protein